MYSEHLLCSGAQYVHARLWYLVSEDSYTLISVHLLMTKHSGTLLIKENVCIVATQSILNALVLVTLRTHKHQKTQICTLYILEGTCWAKVYVGRPHSN